jgi:hypothetical protein
MIQLVIPARRDLLCVQAQTMNRFRRLASLAPE